VQGGGNTKSPPAKRENPQHWFIWTIKHTGDIEDELQVKLGAWCSHFCFQLERGEESGYLHYQGVMRLVKRTRWTAALKLLPEGTHLEIVKSYKDAWLYCQKDETRVRGPWTKMPEAEAHLLVHEWPEARRPIPTEWYPWQKEVLDIVAELPDERTVVWVYDETGGKGKTTLGHEICRNYDGIVIEGKKGDVLCMASEKWHRVWLVCMDRDMSPSDAPYGAIEKLKDGLYMNGKYETKSVIEERMSHVVVLANCKPIMGKLTKDRWKVITL